MNSNELTRDVTNIIIIFCVLIPVMIIAAAELDPQAARITGNDGEIQGMTKSPVPAVRGIFLYAGRGIPGTAKAEDVSPPLFLIYLPDGVCRLLCGICDLLVDLGNLRGGGYNGIHFLRSLGSLFARSLSLGGDLTYHHRLFWQFKHTNYKSCKLIWRFFSSAS